MCGIAGILAYRDSAPPIDEAELLRIREHMVHRGPDGAGLWISPDRRVGLAHRRLAIIDLSAAGHQPMRTRDGRYVVIYNGEIYNFQELRLELEALGHQIEERELKSGLNIVEIKDGTMTGASDPRRDGVALGE